MLVAHGASLEAVDKVRTHTHALLDTCCMKDVCVIMRSMRMVMTYVHVGIYIHSYYIYMNMYIAFNLCSICIYTGIYRYMYTIFMYIVICMHTYVYTFTYIYVYLGIYTLYIYI